MNSQAVNQGPDNGGNASGLVGQRVRRVEDKRLLRGRGRYVADAVPPSSLHAAFLRSPHAHARITAIDTAEAQRLPGVVTVLTGATIEELTNPFPPSLPMPGLYTPLFHSLSRHKVRLVGDPVAMVVAVSREVAEDACELIEVDYEVLDGIGSIARALEPGAPAVWERAPSNVLMDATDTFGDRDIDDVFRRADHVFTETFTCPRQSNQPMEPRGITVEIDPDAPAGTPRVTVRSSTQSSHLVRWALAALAERPGAVGAMRRFAADRGKVRQVLRGAKAYVADNLASLQASDPAGTLHQLRTEPATGLHLLRTLAGVAGRDDYPRVVADDIGGGFGSKGNVHREEVAVAAAALALGRSVTWIEDRMENLLDGGQAREEQMTVSVAVDADGTLRGLDVDLLIDHGAYPGFPLGAALASRIMKVMQPGAYRWDAYRMRARLVATNKGKYVPYRGPWANETWVRERMLNVVAGKLGLSQTEIRRRNVFTESELTGPHPPSMITGPALDETMSVAKTLDRAIELADLERFEATRAEALAAGSDRVVGVGFACYHEAAPGPADYWEYVNPGTSALIDQPARATVEADGRVRVYTVQMPHGQSHETTYAQIAADELGVAIDDVEVVYGDTSATPFEFLGTGGSRGGPLGGGAIRKVGRRLRSDLVEAAAELLEASADDIRIVEGNVHVAGVPARGLSLADLAGHRLSGRVGTGPTPEDAGSPVAFEARERYLGAGDGGWSVATHVCWVEVDLTTGFVTIPRYLVVEDCGPVINPAIVDGQVRGGVAQGIGAVLYERLTYTEDGTHQASTYLDYLLPTSAEIPRIEIDHLETRSPGENDFRGVGEGGMIGAPAALTNAIEDALAHRGVTITEQYLPPFRLLELTGLVEPDPVSY